MTPWSVTFSGRAAADLEQAFVHYLEVADLVLAERFRDAVDQALGHIARNPGTGSSRYGLLNGDEPLRFWTLNHFPYAIFYLAERDARVHVVRVLHQASNIQHHLSQP